MKKSFAYLALSFLLLFACQNSNKVKLTAPKTIEGLVIGDSIANNNVNDAETLLAIIAHEKATKIKLKAKVKGVLKNGTWLRLEAGKEHEIIVSFKDEKLLFPTSIVGKEVVIEGEARVEPLSAAQQKDFIVETNASEGEINKLKTAKKVVLFETKGLVAL